MSAREQLHGRIVDALRADASLGNALNAVLDAPQPKAARPYALVEEPIGSDWGTVDAEGREFRVAVQLRFGSVHSEAIRRLADAVEAVIAKMPSALGDDWKIISRRLMRTRIQRESSDRWVTHTEFRPRVLRIAA